MALSPVGPRFNPLPQVLTSAFAATPSGMGAAMTKPKPPPTLQTPNADASSSEGGGAMDEIKGLLEKIVGMLQQLMQMLSGKGGAQGGAEGGPGGAAAASGTGGGGGGGAGGANGAAGPGGAAAAGTPGPSGLVTNDPRIDAALAKIAQDPDGRRLLEVAQQKGLKSISANPNLAQGLEGEYQHNGTIDIKDASSKDLIATIVHELGHAATPENNSSQAEERVVDALGARVQERLTGQAKGWELNTSAYNDLPQDNNAVGALRAIGIAV